MQPIPAVSSDAADTSADHAFQAASSSSVQTGMPTLRSGSPQQALLLAASDGDSTAVKRLLAAGGVEVNAIDVETQLTPLMLAARQGHDDVVFALTKGMPATDLNLRNSRGESALSLAAGAGRNEVVSLLLDRKGNPEQCSHNGRTVLTEAVACGRHRGWLRRMPYRRGARQSGRAPGHAGPWQACHHLPAGHCTRGSVAATLRCQ